MKTKVLMVLFILEAASLSAQWGGDNYRNDGRCDGDWNHRDHSYGYPMTPAGQEQFLTDNPGVKTLYR